MLINRFLVNLQEIKSGGHASDFSEFAADMSLVFAHNMVLPQVSQAEVDEAAPTLSRRVMSSFSRTRTFSQRGPDVTNLLAESPTESNQGESASSSPIDHAEEIQEVRIIVPLLAYPLTWFGRM